ncbi:MAG: hypothetical protein ACTSUE_00555 [Promethearchaeota archaeon]
MAAIRDLERVLKSYIQKNRGIIEAIVVDEAGSVIIDELNPRYKKKTEDNEILITMMEQIRKMVILSPSLHRILNHKIFQLAFGTLK